MGKRFSSFPRGKIECLVGYISDIVQDIDICFQLSLS